MKLSKEEFVERMLADQDLRRREKERKAAKEYYAYTKQSRARQTRKYKWSRNVTKI